MTLVQVAALIALTFAGLLLVAVVFVLVAVGMSLASGWTTRPHDGTD